MDTNDKLNSRGNSVMYSANIRDGYPTGSPSNPGNNNNNNADNNNPGYVKAWFFSKGQNQDGIEIICIPSNPG
jgi:hypothetical protein